MDSTWFKWRSYDWSWTFTSLRGLLLTFIYLATLIYFFARADASSLSARGMLLEFALPFLFFTALFLSIAYKRGESAR